jgi:DNA uptake protein ComE-like DNA-binding protein
MRRTLFFTLSLALFASIGCSPSNPNPTPEQIRQDTAKATATAARDTKAAIEGVVDGLKSKTPGTGNTVNVNRATADELETLPGVDDVRARRIIANRPYEHSDDLVKKHAISKAEYDRISSEIVAN